MILWQVEKLLLELESASANGTAENGAPSKASGALGRDGFGEGVGTEEARSRLLERIASEMNRLRFYVARAAVSISKDGVYSTHDSFQVVLRQAHLTLQRRGIWCPAIMIEAKRPSLSSTKAYICKWSRNVYL